MDITGDRTQMRTTRGPSRLASTTRRRSGDDLAVVLDKPGCAPSRMISNNRIWGCGLPGTEHMIVNCGVKSWKRQRSSRGTLHDDGDGWQIISYVHPTDHKDFGHGLLTAPSDQGQHAWPRVSCRRMK